MDEEKYLESLEEKLLNAERFKFEERKSFPKSPGCYLGWQNDVIIYVGETTNLFKRIRKMSRSGGHSLRKRIGRKLYSEPKSTKRFTPEKEDRLTQYLINNIKISYLVAKLGRKELEEIIKDKYNPEYNNMSNKKKVRLI
jgi:hypothetical protein